MEVKNMDKITNEELLLFVIFQMVQRNAEHPGGKGTLPLEGGQMGDDFQHFLTFTLP